MIVRPATSGDRAFIEELGKRTSASSIATLRAADENDVRQRVAELVGFVFERSHIALVAENEDAAAGFLLALDDLPDEVTGQDQLFVAYMAVEPQQRGRGAGAALLAAAEDEARKRGLSYIALMVTEDNATARALYGRLGYVTERRLLCKSL